MGEEAKEIRQRENNIQKKLTEIVAKIDKIIDERTAKLLSECKKLEEQLSKVINQMKNTVEKSIVCGFYKDHDVENKEKDCAIDKPEEIPNALDIIMNHIKECKHEKMYKDIIEKLMRSIYAWKNKKSDIKNEVSS